MGGIAGNLTDLPARFDFHKRRPRFEEEGHRYFDSKGAPLFGVTTIIRDAGLMGSYGFAGDWHLLRGSYVHKACHLWSNGLLDPESVDDEHVRPYLDGWRNAVDSLGITDVFTEQPMMLEDEGLAGTMDVFGRVRGRWGIIDLKRSDNEETWHRWQTAGYARLAYPEHPRELLRFTIYLTKTRTGFFFRQHDRWGDHDDFVAVLRTAHMRKEVRVAV